MGHCRRRCFAGFSQLVPASLLLLRELSRHSTSFLTRAVLALDCFFASQTSLAQNRPTEALSGSTDRLGPLRCTEAGYPAAQSRRGGAAPLPPECPSDPSTAALQ